MVNASTSWSLIQGASRGLGLEMVRQLLAGGESVVATCRDVAKAIALRELAADVGQARLRILTLDLHDEASMQAAAAAATEWDIELVRLINVAGLLHDGDLGPERKLDEVQLSSLRRVFEVNAFGPLLVAKAFAPLLRADGRAVLANVSARVGSIGDNRMGGWYAYRASKTAQNMFTKNLAIELGRRRKELVVLAVHPGTVATDLSAPFASRLGPDRRFPVERGAAQVLAVIDRATRDDHGKFFAWDGSEIEW